MHTVRVYLKSGRYFDIEADIISCKHNTITGELMSLSYEGATDGIPLYLDVNQVAALIFLGWILCLAYHYLRGDIK